MKGRESCSAMLHCVRDTVSGSSSRVFESMFLNEQTVPPSVLFEENVTGGLEISVRVRACT